MDMLLNFVADYLAIIMFVTVFLVIFSGFPVAFVLGGTALLFAVAGWALGIFRLESLQIVLLRAWGGMATEPVLVALPMFIFMGSVLLRSGVAANMMKGAQALLRPVPGSLAVTVMIIGTILAASIGVVGASVVLLSMIGLPEMLRQNYSKHLAVGTIGAAGTLGILIPPSVMLVVMSEMLSTSAGGLFAAAVIPGLVLSGLFLTYIIAVAIINPKAAPRQIEQGPPLSWRELGGNILRGLVPMTVLMIVVLGSIFAGFATPTESSGIGVAGALLLAWMNSNLNLKMLKDAIHEAVRANALVFTIIIGATAFSYVFRSIGGDDTVMEVLLAMGIDNKWEILIFIMVLVFLLGFAFDWIEVCLIVLPIFVPILLQQDYSDYLGDNKYFMPWFATLLAVNLQSSFMTPPFGGTLFYMRGTVPPGISMLDIYKSMVPFVILQLTGLALIAAFPWLSLWLPSLGGFLD
jgi:tripartite ATP-independent transporter DctM subunit